MDRVKKIRVMLAKGKFFVELELPFYYNNQIVEGEYLLKDGRNIKCPSCKKSAVIYTAKIKRIPAPIGLPNMKEIFICRNCHIFAEFTDKVLVIRPFEFSWNTQEFYCSICGEYLKSKNIAQWYDKYPFFKNYCPNHPNVTYYSQRPNGANTAISSRISTIIRWY